MWSVCGRYVVGMWLRFLYYYSTFVIVCNMCRNPPGFYACCKQFMFFVSRFWIYTVSAQVCPCRTWQHMHSVSNWTNVCFVGGIRGVSCFRRLQSTLPLQDKGTWIFSLGKENGILGYPGADRGAGGGNGNSEQVDLVYWPHTDHFLYNQALNSTKTFPCRWWNGLASRTATVLFISGLRALQEFRACSDQNLQMPGTWLDRDEEFRLE